MLIDRVEIWHVSMPLLQPWKTAYGSDSAQQSVIVKMTTSDGVFAHGESAPFAAPTYSPEWAAGVFALVKDWLAPRLVGKDIRSGEQLQEALSVFKGNPFAKAALDTAWWNLHAKMEGRPLHELLGATRDSVAVGADFGVQPSLESLVQQVGQAIEAGFPRIKLKMMPGWDRAMLEAVRAAHPQHTLHVDCNCGYAADDPLWGEIDAFDLAMVEQHSTA
jgi:O-succinylbenzoate synthase